MLIECFFLQVLPEGAVILFCEGTFSEVNFQFLSTLNDVILCSVTPCSLCLRFG